MPDARPTETLTLGPLDNRALANLCGPLDANLRQIEAALDVAISHRGADFAIAGAPRQTASRRHARCSASMPKRRSRCRWTTSSSAWSSSTLSRRGSHRAGRHGRRVPLLRTRRTDLHGRTPNQVAYLKAIGAHDITFGIGPAGTGKTYLAVACAVDALERDTVKRIVLVRPRVEAGERLGFLPGDSRRRSIPYLRPLYDALYDLMGFDKVDEALRAQHHRDRAARVHARAHAQPLLHHPRRGAEHHARADEDVPHAHRLRHQGGDHGRRHADRSRARPEERADRGRQDPVGVRGIAFVKFTSADVVRHPLVQKIIDAYERETSTRAGDGPHA
jgi:phosphate starvation-inducible PhoH-like protein